MAGGNHPILSGYPDGTLVYGDLEMKKDWWSRIGVLIAGGGLLCTLAGAGLAGAVWVIDHRISDQLAPLKADLVQIKTALGISSTRPIALRSPPDG